MLAYFKTNFCIDTSRIYATGKSNGGGFVGNVLACDPALSKEFAAFAPVVSAILKLSKGKSILFEKVPSISTLLRSENTTTREYMTLIHEEGLT